MKKLIFLLLLALPFFGFSQAAYLMEFTNPNGSKVVFNLNDVRSCVAEGTGSYLFTRTGSGKTQVQESPATIATNSCGNIVLFTVYSPLNQYNTTKQMGVNPNYVVGVVSNTSGNGVLKMVTPTENFTTTGDYDAAVSALSICVSGGGGGGSLTNTYVGFGDGLNQLDGEAGFTYDAEANRLAVDTVKTKRISSKSGQLELLNDTKFNAYPNTRNDAGLPVNVLTTSATGGVESHPVLELRDSLLKATNGTSYNSISKSIELGNAVGGTSAQLTSARQIPLNGNSILISGPTLRDWKFDDDGLYSNINNTRTFGIGFQLGMGNTGTNFSGGAGYLLGHSNTGNNFSGGAGYLLGYLNNSNGFSGGAGVQLGYQNTRANFSGGAGVQLGYQNTGAEFSGGAGTQLGYTNTGDNFSGGAGYQLGYQNTGAEFSGGAGYQLGYQNNKNKFSGGAGVQLGYTNTGINFSGGAGYQLGYQNSGSGFAGGAGIQLGYQNVGANFSGGAGGNLGYGNTGANFSGGAGTQLGYTNTGNSFSGGAGYQLGYQNTATDFSGGAGIQLGYRNAGANFSGGAGGNLGYENTGSDFSGGAGYSLGYQNVGANFSGGAGVQLGYQNAGANFIGGAGYKLGAYNTGSNFCGQGYGSGQSNRGDNIVVFGTNSASPIVLGTGSVLSSDISAGVISGATATAMIATVSGVDGGYYPFLITGVGNYRLRVSGSTLTGAPVVSSNTTYEAYSKLDNCAVFGNNVNYTKANQVNIGNSDQTEVRLVEKYAIDVSATLGAADNGKVWTYEHSTGSIKMMDVAMPSFIPANTFSGADGAAAVANAILGGKVAGDKFWWNMGAGNGVMLMIVN